MTLTPKNNKNIQYDNMLNDIGEFILLMRRLMSPGSSSNSLETQTEVDKTLPGCNGV